MNTIKRIKEDINPKESLEHLIDVLHKFGPVDNRLIENLTYYKIFHSNVFSIYEDKIIIELGLFYKNIDPQDLSSFILSGIGRLNKKLYGAYLTPVQASIRSAIEHEQYVSISAPTSAGKSYSIRDYISSVSGDVVIIVPSRALIAEYIKNLKEKFGGNKKIMISSFADHIFTSRKLRHIFVLTPERSRDLFSLKEILNIDLFFFDEAQVCEEKERGVTFDVLIRRVKKNFPNSKLVFAHPFVENPDAQMKKHELDSQRAFSRSYPHNTVGKSFVFGHSNGHDYFFSPYIKNGHHLNNSIKFNHKFDKFAFDGSKSVLVFVSKASLYDGRFKQEFEQHINNFDKVEEPVALNLIEKISNLLGANITGHRSVLVELLKIGVVIHHGSVPLEVRFLIEDFLRGGFAKICFATSTLAQGINMPFDIVWVSNMRIQANSDEERALAFKNLIGRSGRLTDSNVFDYGYVYTKNAKLLSQRVTSPYTMSEHSILDGTVDDLDPDIKEVIESISEGTFNEDFNIPQSKIDRVTNVEAIHAIKEILDIIFSKEIGSNLRGDVNKNNRDRVKRNLKFIFQLSIGRDLLKGEDAIFSNAISILFLIIQSKSFKEIVGFRYSYASGRDGNGAELVPFMQPASKIPDISLVNAYPMFDGIKSKDVSYDRIVFDTYDYLDTVISFSLSNVFLSTLRVYYSLIEDPNALKMMDLLKYGTVNPIHTLLLRYGFASDDLEKIEKYILNIDESNIVFNDELQYASKEMQDKVSWYLS